MNTANRSTPIKTPFDQTTLNILPSHLPFSSIDKHGHRHAKSLIVQNQLVDELKRKITYLTQQITQYKLLVSKLQTQLKQKSQKLSYSSGVITNNQLAHQRMSKSITKSLNRSQFFPKKVIEDLSEVKYNHQESRRNSTTNICILEDVVKLLEVHCCQEVIPILKQKLKRLSKLENFSECVSSLRVAFDGHVDKAKSLKSNWRWIKEMVDRKEGKTKTKSPSRGR